MKPSKEFSKKLSAYSLIAGAMFGASQKSGAQVIYTDVNPDDTIQLNQKYFLDLNNDGVSDFFLTPTDGTFGYFNVAEIGNAFSNAVMGVYNTWRLPYNLQTDVSIGAGGPWIDIAYSWSVAGWFFLYRKDGWSTQNTGFWMDGSSEGLTGLQFHINGETHYGWLRLQIADDASFMILEEYAYNSIADEGLLAGSSLPLGQSLIHESVLQIFPNPASDKIFISNQNENFIGEASVFDLSGRKIFSQEISSRGNVVDVSSFAEGFYILELKNENETLVKKFEVKR